VIDAARTAFVHSFHASGLISAGLVMATAIFVVVLLRSPRT
jgi:hypothetical protein